MKFCNNARRTRKAAASLNAKPIEYKLMRPTSKVNERTVINLKLTDHMKLMAIANTEKKALT